MGPDQRPHIELAQEVARRFNRTYGDVFPVPEGVYGNRLEGTDGKNKMGKSYGNAIDLADRENRIKERVMAVMTDPGRVRATDPGCPEVCSAFHYRKVFGEARAPEVASACRAGAVGCTDCKADLAKVIQGFLAPFRERRAEFEKQPNTVRDILNLGCAKARIVGQRTLERVKEVMGLRYKSLLG